MITDVYVDPIDAIWLQLAREIGWTIERSDEVYASTDGRGRVWLGTNATLDPDDCLAQMILHELCHACVQGELGAAPDWGLDNTTDRDVEREHACLRLQAHLTDRHGLRRVLAPTTEFRAFYDTLERHPLAGDERSAQLANEGERWLRARPWALRLDEALASTATISALGKAFGVRTIGARPVLWTHLGSPTKGSRSGE